MKTKMEFDQHEVLLIRRWLHDAKVSVEQKIKEGKTYDDERDLDEELIELNEMRERFEKVYFDSLD